MGVASPTRIPSSPTAFPEMDGIVELNRSSWGLSETAPQLTA